MYFGCTWHFIWYDSLHWGQVIPLLPKDSLHSKHILNATEFSIGREGGNTGSIIFGIKGIFKSVEFTMESLLKSNWLTPFKLWTLFNGSNSGGIRNSSLVDRIGLS